MRPPQRPLCRNTFYCAYEQMRVDFVAMQGHFAPELIEWLSAEWNVPKNFLFIGSPGDRFPYQISELGGMRLII